MACNPKNHNSLKRIQDQSRKVLEEVQLQKKILLKQGAAVTLNPTPVSTAIPVS